MVKNTYIKKHALATACLWREAGGSELGPEAPEGRDVSFLFERRLWAEEGKEQCSNHMPPDSFSGKVGNFSEVRLMLRCGSWHPGHCEFSHFAVHEVKGRFCGRSRAMGPERPLERTRSELLGAQAGGVGLLPEYGLPSPFVFVTPNVKDTPGCGEAWVSGTRLFLWARGILMEALGLPERNHMAAKWAVLGGRWRSAFWGKKSDSLTSRGIYSIKKCQHRRKSERACCIWNSGLHLRWFPRNILVVCFLFSAWHLWCFISLADRPVQAALLRCSFPPAQCQAAQGSRTTALEAGGANCLHFLLHITCKTRQVLVRRNYHSFWSFKSIICIGRLRYSKYLYTNFN